MNLRHFHPRRLKGLLRSPRLILAEIIALTLLAVLGASLPQRESALEPTKAPVVPGVAQITAFLGLDHVFSTPVFALLTILAATSLMVVIWDQLRRLHRSWNRQLALEDFSRAPLRVEFERESRGEGACKTVRIWSERKLGLAGSPVFHLGLLLVMVAGALRALFGTQCMVDLIEGETLEPGSAWAEQWPGLWAKPLKLTAPLELKSVTPSHYNGGELRDLKACLAWPTPSGIQESEIRVNKDLEMSGSRLFLVPEFGPAAVVDWQNREGGTERRAALLSEISHGKFRGACAGPKGEMAFFHAEVAPGSTHPALVEVRVMNKRALLVAADMRPGQSIILPDGDRLALEGLPLWTRLKASRDPSLWAAYSGFALAMVGALLIFGVTKIDLCVLATPKGEREHVFVALKAQRFVPLLHDRFFKLVREQGGGAPFSPELILSEPAAGKAAKARSACSNGCELCLRRALTGPCRASRLQQPVATCLLVLLGLGLTGCSPSPAKQARALVERYNTVVAEAYRRGDVRLIDSVVGPNEGKKITGLIGVRLDLGLTMDSHLLALEVTSVQKQSDQLKVRTWERWSYRDLKIGSGQQVGEASTDSYEMLYVFKRIDKAWLVDEIQFAAEPRVGRKTPTWAAERKPHENLPQPETSNPRT